MSDNFANGASPEFSRHRGAGIGEEIRQSEDERAGRGVVDVTRGQIFGLLGPNGAGKTTIIGVLTTAIVPTEGSASIMSVDVTRDPISVKQRIAVVPQQSNLDRSLKLARF